MDGRADRRLGHPRNQRMPAFLARRRAAAPALTDDKRDLTVEEAAALQVGENHYRAYVGPPNRFDFMSATQFSLLFANGLRDHHRVLDFRRGLASPGPAPDPLI